MKTTKGQQPRARKAPYTPPCVVDYGSVAKLTQNGNGSGADGGTGTMMMNCL